MPEFRKEDDFGPYAASWPTHAAICRYAPNASGAPKRAAIPDGTLFLLAAPGLEPVVRANSIPFAARFATPCRTNARGGWFRFVPDSEPSFVLVEAGGGNCGDTLRVFDHSVSYDSPHVGEEAFQDHTFQESYSRGCVHATFVGDLDNDGRLELVVREIIEFGQSRADSKSGYRVLRLDGKGFCEDREVDADDVARHRSLVEL